MTGDRLCDVGGSRCPIFARPAQAACERCRIPAEPRLKPLLALEAALRRPLLPWHAVRLVAVCAGLALTACGPQQVRLHAPDIAETDARSSAVKVDVEPLVTGAAVATTVGTGEILAPHPDPSAVLTSAIRAELAGRALRGGESGGYVVRCTLDRFAIRDEEAVASRAFAVLYADAACDVLRASDSRLAWRGELRGRACARGSLTIERSSRRIQPLIDRMMSDAAREMASDLLVRVLGLSFAPSERVFEAEVKRSKLGGVDDADLGRAELAERIADRPALEQALGDTDADARASAWNLVAMTVGPGDPWPLGDTFVPDEDARVRFYQYKALAREASAATLTQLKDAASHETNALLQELARDSVASGGLGFPRTPRANATTATNGTTTSP